SVTVEGHYKPEVFAADRLAMLPEVLMLKVADSPMRYDRKGVTAAFAPDALPMTATGWRTSKDYDRCKGYVDVRLGSWLNSSVSAGYNAIRNEDTRLNVYLQHNSTSLWQAWKENADAGIPAADRRFRYDETIGADLQQKIGYAGVLTAAAQYHLGYFNYYGTDSGSSKEGRISAPTQTLNDVYVKAGWTGPDIGKLSYGADAEVRYFGYRSMYLPLPGTEGKLAADRGSRETELNIGGNVRYKTGKNAQIEVNVRYSGVINAVGNNVNRGELIPAYVFSRKSLSLRLGLNAAVTGNGERTRFRIAPDVMLSARKGIVAFSASAGGGTHLRTLAWAHTYDYYSDPGTGCYRAAYTPVDARIAVQLNPGGRWTFGVDGAWRTTIDETFGGYYQALLNGTMLPGNAFPEGGRIHGFSLGVNAGYDFCRYISLKGKGTWQPQDGSKGYFNGFDRAAFTAEVSAESRPIDKLIIGLCYRLRAKRLLLSDNISRLDLKGDYRITDRISVGAELNNLLNRHEEMLPGLPLEGFNLTGGVQITF
ncbi:MAG: hypothetical protein K2H49_04045, partial [Muribaculaceae bacterium]|nr:hypothetical protein [Muribaculaceae bacterium]